MDSFPDEFEPNKFNTEENKKRLFLEAQKERLEYFRTKFQDGHRYHFSRDDLQANTETINSFLEKLREIINGNSEMTAVVEYCEGMANGPQDVDPNNYRIQVFALKKETYATNVNEDKRTLRQLIVKQMNTEPKASEERQARVYYNVYNEAIEGIDNELKSRGWETNLLRNWRGLNCNKGSLVFEVRVPQTTPPTTTTSAPSETQPDGLGYNDAQQTPPERGAFRPIHVNHFNMPPAPAPWERKK
jgi:hypothetical protein